MRWLKHDYMFPNFRGIVRILLGGGLPLGDKHFREGLKFEDAMYDMGVWGSKQNCFEKKFFKKRWKVR